MNLWGHIQPRYSPPMWVARKPISERAPVSFSRARCLPYRLKGDGTKGAFGPMRSVNVDQVWE